MINSKAKKYILSKEKYDITLKDLVEYKRAENKIKEIELKENLKEIFDEIWRTAY